MEQVVRGNHVGRESHMCAEFVPWRHGSFVVWAVYMSELQNTELTARFKNIRAETPDGQSESRRDA